MKTNERISLYVTHFFVEFKMFQTKVIEKIKPHILCSITFFFLNCAMYVIMWKNTAEAGRPQMAIWYMCIVCWIPKATNTNPNYVILIAFQPQ